jgi:hypothetical protein
MVLRRLELAAQVLLVVAAGVFLGYRGVQPLVFRVPHGNEMVLHQTLTSRVIESGGSHNPWVPHYGGGAAVLQFSGHLAHLLSACLVGPVALFGGSGEEAVVVVNAIFLALLPAATWFGLRGLGLRRWGATAGALAALVLDADRSEALLQGAQARCFTWDGAGHMPRLVALVFSWVAVGAGAPFVAAGRGSAWLAALTAALAWLSHFGVAYGTSLLLLAGAVATGEPRAVGRWLLVHAGTAVALLYVAVPAWLDWAVLSTSFEQPVQYWRSVGLRRALELLWTGRLFDWVPETRVRVQSPWFTHLVIAAAAWLVLRLLWDAAVRQRRPAATQVTLVVLSGAALVLFAGPDAMGPFVNLLPFGRSLLPFSHFLAHVHMAGIALVGWLIAELLVAVVGMLTFVESLTASSSSASAAYSGRRAIKLVVLLVAAGSFAAATAPGLWAEALQVREDLHGQHIDFYGWWGEPLLGMMRRAAELARDLPGRAYAGTRWNWGEGFDIKFIKMYTLWTVRGLNMPSLGNVWHGLSHTAELDRYFVESRPDHHALYNVRYVLCNRDGLPHPFRRASEESVGHALHEWTSAQGYFGLIRVDGCIDGWKMNRTELHNELVRYVQGQEHGQRLHQRLALHEGEACASSGEQMDRTLSAGVVMSQSGNMDDFEARIDCREPRGCSVLLRVSFHPGFVASRAGSPRPLRTFSVAPGYLAFVVPFGVDSYRVAFRTPWWRSLLFCACVIYMSICAAGSVVYYVGESRRRAAQRAAAAAAASVKAQKVKTT